MKTLYQRLVEVMRPEDIDHHRSDLYVKVTPTSTDIIIECGMEYKEEMGLYYFPKKFKSNIPPHDTWYDCPFAYDPFWGEASKK